MLRPLIDRLRARAPLQRSSYEMAELLTAASVTWSPGKPLFWRPHAYTRTCAYRDETFEVLLLNWDPGAASAVHDHGGKHCWMLVLGGRLQVDDYVRVDGAEVPGIARIAPRGSSVLGAGGLDVRSGPFDLHRVSATPDAPAVSLHVYSAPLYEYLVYDEKAERCERARGIYDDGLADVLVTT